MSAWRGVTKKYGSQAAYLQHLLKDKKRDQLEALLIDKAARQDDQRYYGDHTFRADEQKEKTAALNDLEINFEGYENLAEPGFHPPVLPYIKNVRPYYKVPGLPKTKYDTKNKKWLENHTDQYPIFPLQFAQIPIDATILLIGKRRSGKTKFIFSLLEYFRPWFPRVFVFTKTKYSGEYAKYIPRQFIITGLDIEKFGALLAIQKLYKKAQEEGTFGGNNKVLFIIDDCLSDGLKYQSLIDESFFEGRHLNMMIIVSSQDPKGIAPAVKGNADLSVYFRMTMERDKEATKSCGADFFKKPAEFDAIAETVWEHPYHFVAFTRDTPHKPPELCVFAGRAVDPKFPFVMGSKGFWKNSEHQLTTAGFENALFYPHWGVEGDDGVPIGSVDRRYIHPQPGTMSFAEQEGEKDVDKIVNDPAFAADIRETLEISDESDDEDRKDETSDEEEDDEYYIDKNAAKQYFMKRKKKKKYKKRPIYWIHDEYENEDDFPKSLMFEERERQRQF